MADDIVIIACLIVLFLATAGLFLCRASRGGKHRLSDHPDEHVGWEGDKGESELHRITQEQVEDVRARRATGGAA